MKNNYFRKAISLFLCFAMLLSFSAVYAQTETNENETVYVLLNDDGSTKQIIVSDGENEEKDVKGELPFAIKLDYKFDGTKVKPQDVLGKKGKVEISIDITPNEKAKTYYNENLALQMQFPLNTDKNGATNIKADGLTNVTVGLTKTLGAIVLPSKSAKYEISYTTECFEQQSINFVCMPFSLTGVLDAPVAEQITQLQTGISTYTDGVGSASSGLNQLSSGGNQLTAAYTQATTGENALLQAMLGSMPPEQQAAFAPQIAAMQAGQQQVGTALNTYVGGISQINSGMTELAKGGTAIKEGINSAIAPIANMPNTKTDETALPQSFISDKNVTEIQFVMKTDTLTDTTTKKDVQPAKKADATFFDRLIALFGF